MPLIRPILARPVAAALLAAALGCDGDTAGVPRGPFVSVAPSTITAIPGDTVRFRITDQQGRTLSPATLTPSNAGLRVDANGVVTAVAPGPTAFIATVVSDGTSVQVGVPVTVLGFTVVPASLSLAPGATMAVQPGFVGDAALYRTLAWSSADTTVARIDASGTVRGVSPGVTRITAVSSADPRLRAEAPVTVVCSDLIVQSLTATPTSVNLGVGATQQLTTSVVLGTCVSPTTSRDLVFSSSDTTIATVSPSGLVTGRWTGTAVITVAAAAAPSVALQIPVAVLCGCADRVTVQSITTDDPAVAIDPTAVRGPIRVTINAGAPQNDVRHAELWLGGRLAMALDSVPKSSAEVTTFTLRVDAAARDPLTGARLYPLGESLLEIRVTLLFPGGRTQTASVPVTLTLVDP